MAERLGPNDLEPCGTVAARVRHNAHGVLCARCNAADRPHIAAFVERLETELADARRQLAEVEQREVAAQRRAETQLRQQEVVDNRVTTAVKVLEHLLLRPVVSQEPLVRLRAFLAGERSRP